jgi:hypothetical protein
MAEPGRSRRHVRSRLFGEAPDDGTTGEPDKATPDPSNPCDRGDPPQWADGGTRSVLRLFAG